VTRPLASVRARLSHGDSTARAALIAAVDEDPLEAAALLGDVGAAWTIEPLAELARHPDPSIRNEAIIGLARTNSALAIPPLLCALEDPELERRDDARVALVSLIGSEIVDHLADEGDDDPGERARAETWWRGNKHRFADDVAIHRGSPLSIEAAVEELEVSRPEVIGARLDTIQNWVGSDVEGDTPAAKVKAMRVWWDQNRERFVDGRRYFQGHPV